MERLLRALSATLLFSLTVAAQTQPPPAGISARAMQIHNSAIVVDTHADTPQRFLDEGFDIGNSDPNDIGN